MVTQSRALFIIQANYRSWDGSRDFSISEVDGKPVIFWVIERLKKIAPKENILIAAGNIPENKIFREIASLSGVRCYFGAKDNIIERFLKASEAENPDVIVKVLGQAYFVDTDLICQLVKLREEKDFDLVTPPEGFNMKIGSAVIKRKALLNLSDLIARGKIAHSSVLHNIGDIQANPIQYVAMRKDLFKIGYLTDIRFSKTKDLAMREKAKEIFVGERMDYDEKSASEAGNILLRHYEFALSFIKKSDVVLDAACGNGYGTMLIAQKARSVIGVDYSYEIIEEARLKRNKPNTVFVVNDVLHMPFLDDYFDIVISMETIEHVEGEQFSAELCRVLKKGGRLILSTPQNPFGQIPIIPCHVKEYSNKELRDLLSEKFTVEKLYSTKSCIIDEDPMGSGMVVVARK